MEAIAGDKLGLALAHGELFFRLRTSSLTALLAVRARHLLDGGRAARVVFWCMFPGLATFTDFNTKWRQPL
jgi:hypothetical protein